MSQILGQSVCVLYVYVYTHIYVTSLVGCALRITILDGLHIILRITVAKGWAEEVDLMKEIKGFQNFREKPGD